MQKFSKSVISRALNPQSLGFFTQREAKAKNLRLCLGNSGEKGTLLTLYILIDEEDGVIADAKFQVFGPPEFVALADVACGLLIRKNYMQARRMSSEILEKELPGLSSNTPRFLNFVLEAIDLVAESCMDIPIEDIYVAPPEMEGGERQEYPGWQLLTDAQKKIVLTEIMERDVTPYVELDGGGVEILSVEDNRVKIAYSGNCTSCFSATGATLDAIGNILRRSVFPDLMVIPDMSALSMDQG